MLYNRKQFLPFITFLTEGAWKKRNCLVLKFGNCGLLFLISHDPVNYEYVTKREEYIEKHKKINNRASKFTKIPNVPNDSKNTSGSPFNYNLTILFILTMKELQYLQLDGRKSLKCCTKCVPHFFEKLHQGASFQAQISEHMSARLLTLEKFLPLLAYLDSF